MKDGVAIAWNSGWEEQLHVPVARLLTVELTLAQQELRHPEDRTQKGEILCSLETVVKVLPS